MEDEMKIQNCILCPECGSEIHFGKDGFNNCPKLNCELNGAMLSREFWGRVRIAPNDKDVVNAFIGHEEHGITEHQPWMNPRYPDEE